MFAQALLSTQNSLRRACPACGGGQAYQLGDGRLKCKHCRTKYTPFPKNRRLKPEKLRDILEHFWRMTPTDQVAASLTLNRKTVQKFFRLIRERITEEGENRLALQTDIIDLKGFYVGETKKGESKADHSATVPVFGLANLYDEVCLVFPDGLRDWSKLNLKSVRYVPVKKEATTDSDIFAPVQAVEIGHCVILKQGISLTVDDCGQETSRDAETRTSRPRLSAIQGDGGYAPESDWAIP